MESGAGKRGVMWAAMLATLLATMPAPGRPPVPKFEIIDGIRELAAQQLRKKKDDIDIRESLAAQGMNEAQLNELVIDIGQEFGVVISSRAIFEAKQREPVYPLSVRTLADMVEERMVRQDSPFPE
jgi:acyl carrier protein